MGFFRLYLQKIVQLLTLYQIRYVSDGIEKYVQWIYFLFSMS